MFKNSCLSNAPFLQEQKLHKTSMNNFVTLFRVSFIRPRTAGAMDQTGPPYRLFLHNVRPSTTTNELWQGLVDWRVGDGLLHIHCARRRGSTGQEPVTFFVTYSSAAQVSNAVAVLHQQRFMSDRMVIAAVAEPRRSTSYPPGVVPQPGQPPPPQQVGLVPPQQVGLVPPQQVGLVPPQQVGLPPQQVGQVPPQQVGQVPPQQVGQVPPQQVGQVPPQDPPEMQEGCRPKAPGKEWKAEPAGYDAPVLPSVPSPWRSTSAMPPPPKVMEKKIEEKKEEEKRKEEEMKETDMVIKGGGKNEDLKVGDSGFEKKLESSSVDDDGYGLLNDEEEEELDVDAVQVLLTLTEGLRKEEEEKKREEKEEQDVPATQDVYIEVKEELLDDEKPDAWNALVALVAADDDLHPKEDDAPGDVAKEDGTSPTSPAEAAEEDEVKKKKKEREKKKYRRRRSRSRRSRSRRRSRNSRRSRRRRHRRRRSPSDSTYS